MHKHMAEAMQMLGRHHTMVEPLSTLTARGTVTAHTRRGGCCPGAGRLYRLDTARRRFLFRPIVADDDPRDREAIRHGHQDYPGGQLVRGCMGKLEVGQCALMLPGVCPCASRSTTPNRVGTAIQPPSPPATLPMLSF